MRLSGFLAVIGGCLLIVACGGSSGGGTATTPTPSMSATPAASAPAAGQSVTVTESEFKLDPATATVKAGAVTFMVKNAGQFPHDLHIVDPSNKEVGATTSVLSAGASGQFTATLTAGTYTMFCAVDSHRARGMEGKITVQ